MLALTMCDMKVDAHAFDRMALRLTAEERQTTIDKIQTTWCRVQNACLKDVGIVAMPLSSLRMTDNSGWESNGDTIVGIVRKGYLKTVMLRRMTQPMTKDALRVNKVKWAFKAPPRRPNNYRRF